MIDSNQTRVQLLLGKEDWAQCTTDTGAFIFAPAADSSVPFSWNPSRSEVTLGVRVNVFHSAPANVPPTLDQRRGAAQDRFGTFYWIANSKTEILVNSAGTGVTTHFWSSNDEISRGCTAKGTFGASPTPAPPPALVFSGLAVTTEHYLVAGVLQPKGLVIFDLFHGGPPRRLEWPSPIPFEPFDFAAAPDGGLWILDRTNHLLWRLDRNFSVVRQNQSEVDLSPEPDVFAPADGKARPARPPRTFPSGISLQSASPLVGIDAIAVTTLPDGSVLLLESNFAQGFSTVYRFRDGIPIGEPVSLASVLDLLGPIDRPGFSLLGDDFAFIASEQTPGGTRQNTLYVVGQNGDQSWGFNATYSSDQLALTPIADYYPMRLFGGRGLVTGQNQVYYDSQDRWVPLIVQNRPRYVEEEELFTPVLNGKQPDCVWHKLMLDASIPADTAITVYSRAHNDPALIQAQSWSEEPEPYRRGNGTELPWTQLAACLDTWELLFQRASGQYLQLKLVFSGNGKLTPRLRALRAYYPRFSYLNHYLPGVYRDDDASASFLDRFLANFEGFFTSIEDRIATVQALLDVGSAPNETLGWLANWFGVALDPTWSEAKRRLFLKNAPLFFESRGTVPGLMMALRLTLEDCADQGIFSPAPNEQTGVRIVEGFQQRLLPQGLVQEPTVEVGIPLKTQTAMWTPALGADELNQRYSDTLQAPGTMYPTFLASNDPHYSQWSTFSRSNLGLVPGQPDATSDLWTTFLRTRYGSIGALNTAYRSTYNAFANVPFPSQLPRLSQPLWDWYQFQGVLIVQSAAHQFTVYLPMPPGDAQNVNAHRSKLGLAQRVIELEKPAHTTYEIKFYWAFFRLGEARLGQDSVLDYGSRAPQLLQPALLDDTYLGSVYLTRQPPGRPFLKQGSC